MINEQKGELYDKYLAEVDIIQRQISKLKSQYVVNVPENIQNEIYQKQLKISEYERLVKNLFKY